MGFTKKKCYGQNFLTSPRIPERMVEMSGIDGESGVLEIGVGMGILTEQLIKKAKKVVSVEIDDELIPILTEKYGDVPNLKLIHGDIMKVNLSDIVENELSGTVKRVCANLPYYITTPVITLLVDGGFGFESITVMVQREVADRLCSEKGTAEYGAVTAWLSYRANVKRLFTVPRTAFSPAPNVDSAVILIEPHKIPPVTPKDEALFFKVLKAAFANRRKTFANSLSAAFPQIPKNVLTEIITAVTGSPTVRGEAVDIHGYAAIADMIYEIKNKK